MKRGEGDFVSLRSVLRRLRAGFVEQQGQETLHEIEETWRKVAGEISELTRIKRKKSSEIVVVAANSAVLAEARQFYGERLLEALREKGFREVERIRFELAEE